MWFLFALTFALTSSLGVIIAKRVMKEVDEYLYLWLVNIFTLPFLLIIILYFFQIPNIDSIFLSSMAAAVVIGSAGAIFAYRGIRISDVSLVNPISSFNPIFTAIISFLFLGEKLDNGGVIGILLVVFGAYLLNLSKSKKGVFEPFMALAKHKGVQLSFLAYFLWAITPTLEKTAILHTTPQVPPFASFVGMVGSIVVFTPFVVRFSARPIRLIKKNLGFFILAGALGGIGLASAFIAFSLTNLGFATAIFKLSMLFTVIFGRLFFKEDIKDRLIGSLIMLVGVYLLAT